MKLDQKQKNAILGVLIFLCLLMAGSKVYKAYKAFQPPFEVGECFTVSDPRVGTVEFKVIENDKKSSTTIAVGSVELMPGLKVQVPVQATFEEIRESEAKKVECSQ